MRTERHALGAPASLPASVAEFAPVSCQRAPSGVPSFARLLINTAALARCTDAPTISELFQQFLGRWGKPLKRLKCSFPVPHQAEAAVLMRKRTWERNPIVMGAEARWRAAGRSRAFSLVEVLCAILILGVALAGLTQGITTALNSHKESELQTSAALLAAGRIETLRAEGLLADGSTEGECEGFSLYRWRQTIAPAGLDGLHDVEVAIEHAKTGKTIFELRTLLFEAPSSLSTDDSKTGKSSRDRRKRGAR